MPKDRYGFDQPAASETAKSETTQLKKNWYDERMLNNEPDARITARREARKAKYAKNAKSQVISDEEIKKAKKKERRKVRTSRAIIAIVGFALAIVFVVYAGVRLTSLRVEKKTAQAELDALNLKKQQLEAELAEKDSAEYIEDAARSDLHMIKPGEVMYVVDPSAEAEPEDDGSVKSK